MYIYFDLLSFLTWDIHFTDQKSVVANNMSVAFFVSCHIQQAFLSNNGWEQIAEMDKKPHAAVCF